MDQFGGPLGGGLAVVSAGSCAALDDFADLVESALLPHVINYASKLQIYSHCAEERRLASQDRSVLLVNYILS